MSGNKQMDFSFICCLGKGEHILLYWIQILYADFVNSVFGFQVEEKWTAAGWSHTPITTASNWKGGMSQSFMTMM